MVCNKLQFSVTREDPTIELNLISHFSLKNALLIGSGGCTASLHKISISKYADICY